jgi:hypothetical protein
MVVFIPNPLGKMGEDWKKHKDGDDNTFINLNFFYVDKDDYNTRITVLMFTFIFLIFGICFRKKILNSFRYCCINHEKCKNGKYIVHVYVPALHKNGNIQMYIIQFFRGNYTNLTLM